MNISPPAMARYCENVFTPVIRRDEAGRIRYSIEWGPARTAPGSTAGRPWSARRCWKSTPFDVATPGIDGAGPPEVGLADQLGLVGAGIRGTANSGSRR